MKRIIWIYGAIAGVIVSAMLMISMPLHEKGIVNFDNGVYLGYTSMVIAMSMVFFGVKNYRDNYQNGVVSFGTAFKVGILIATVAAIMYATTWEIYWNATDGKYMAQYSEYSIDKLKAGGATESEIAKAKADMESFGELYAMMPIRFAMSMMEIVPVALIVTLLTAAILRKREILPA